MSEHELVGTFHMSTIEISNVIVPITEKVLSKGQEAPGVTQHSYCQLQESADHIHGIGKRKPLRQGHGKEVW